MDLDQGFQELLIELPNAGDVDTRSDDYVR